MQIFQQVQQHLQPVSPEASLYLFKRRRFGQMRADQISAAAETLHLAEMTRRQRGPQAGKGRQGQPREDRPDQPGHAAGAERDYSGFRHAAVDDMLFADAATVHADRVIQPRIEAPAGSGSHDYVACEQGSLSF